MFVQILTFSFNDNCGPCSIRLAETQAFLGHTVLSIKN